MAFRPTCLPIRRLAVPGFRISDRTGLRPFSYSIFMNKTNQDVDFCKKTYVKPQINVCQAMSAEIICTSGGTSPLSIENEEYEEVSTEITDSWF